MNWISKRMVRIIAIITVVAFLITSFSIFGISLFME